MAFATKSSWPKNTDDRIARIVEMLGNTEGIVAHTKNHPTNGYIFTFIQNGMSREYWVQHSTLCGDRTLTEFFTRFGGEDLRDMLTLFADGRPPFFMTIENERNTEKFAKEILAVFRHDVAVGRAQRINMPVSPEIENINEAFARAQSRPCSNQQLTEAVAQIRNIALKANDAATILLCVRSLSYLTAEHVAGVESRIFAPAEDALVDIGRTHPSLWSSCLFEAMEDSFCLPCEHAAQLANKIDDRVIGGVTWKNADPYP